MVNDKTGEGDGAENTKQRWFPLESNPDLMNDYVRKMGFDTDLYQFYDVFSTEDWALEMIPQPVAAVIMLYPLTDKQTSYRDDDQKLALDVADKVWFIKQRIGNACGTIGILHALLNAPEGLRCFQEGSWLKSFQQDCPCPLDPIEKAKRLEGDNKIAALHDEATTSESNQTGRGDIDDDIITHFIALVHVDGSLYELDGRKQGPVRHSSTTNSDTLLKDATKVVKEFMERDPGELRFTILALAPKQED